MVNPHANPTAPVIAVIGSDGSGKSTVVEHLLRWVARYGEVRQAHLGKQAGNVGRALSRLPLAGRWIERNIRRKTADVHRDFAHAAQPGLLSALVITAFTLRRLHRFRRMLALRRRGYIVLTDRYPQIAVPGAYDGPSLPETGAGSWIERRLARREHAAFSWMASHRPDLVLRLNVDLETACARKPDHPREALLRKIGITPRLSFGGAPIVEIDAARPLPEVLAAAEAAVADLLASRGWEPGR